MKMIIDMVWLLVVIVSGYIAIQMSLYVAGSQGVILSSLAGIVVFVISVCLLAVIVLFVTDRLLPRAGAGTFISDDNGVRFDTDNGAESFLWDDLVKIEITTNDKGPLEEDVFWHFFDGRHNEKITIPQGQKKNKIIKNAVKKRFHSSDDLKMDLALGSCLNKRFVIWQSIDFEAGTSVSDQDANNGIGELKVERNLNQNHWVSFFIVVLALLCYGGYFLFNKYNPETTLWDGMFEVSVELFGLSLIGIMGIYLLSSFELRRFQQAHPSIDSDEALAALKPVVKRCMWLALLVIILIALSFGFLAMIADHHGGKSGMVAAVVLTAVSLVFSQWYDPQEKAFKQIPCTDTELEIEVLAVFNSWEKDLFPKF
ncbi:hypothetical protein [Marinicella rhabdoformis]|uniref:hypothetical protein n=1 Tax=Marinicella rhabdoformis TaxID=2580566 RepID=UPI0012AEB397|nr:hypothetical protein [Marinicella rhabdoformis]